MLFLNPALIHFHVTSQTLSSLPKITALMLTGFLTRFTILKYYCRHPLTIITTNVIKIRHRMATGMDITIHHVPLINIIQA
jgi:hypothetical protein